MRIDMTVTQEFKGLSHHNTGALNFWTRIGQEVRINILPLKITGLH